MLRPRRWRPPAQAAGAGTGLTAARSHSPACSGIPLVPAQALGESSVPAPRRRIVGILTPEPSASWPTGGSGLPHGRVLAAGGAEAGALTVPAAVAASLFVCAPFA